MTSLAQERAYRRSQRHRRLAAEDASVVRQRRAPSVEAVDEFLVQPVEVLEHPVALWRRRGAEQHAIEQAVEAALLPKARGLLLQHAVQRSAGEVRLPRDEQRHAHGVGKRITGGRMEETAAKAQLGDTGLLIPEGSDIDAHP